MQVAIKMGSFFQLDPNDVGFLLFALVPIVWVALNPAGFARTVLRGKKPIPRARLAFTQAMAWICLVGVCTLLVGAWLTRS
ncbi:MAG: hypothetical protein ACRD1E_13295 [Terriglobales bacterium]